LVSEDRAKRKAAIAEIETLLEHVDAAKQRLGGLEKQLQADLDALPAEPEKAPEANVQTHSSPTRHPVGFEHQAAQQRCVPDSSDRGHPPRMPKFVLPTPSRELWEQVRLPVRFQVREMADGYEIRAAVPGMARDDIDIDLGDDSSNLTISGLRAPSARRAEQMHQQLTVWVQQQIQMFPERAQSIVSRLADIARKGFLEMGQNEFGRFSETFRIPHDADTGNIQALYQEGMLSVIIPKRPRRRVPRATYGGLGSPFWGL